MRENPPGKGGRLTMEKWDLLDGDGRPLGQTLVRGDKLRPGQYHLVVHIWVEDSKGRLLIQKRAPHLKLMPDTWAVTGGSALAGEDSLTAAARELSEELGIEAAPSDLKLLGRLRRRNSLCDLWRLRRDVPLSALRLQKEEVADARWVSRGQLMEMVKCRRFHHYGSPYFDFLFRSLDGEPDILPVK